MKCGRGAVGGGGKGKGREVSTRLCRRASCSGRGWVCSPDEAAQLRIGNFGGRIALFMQNYMVLPFLYNKKGKQH